MKHITEMTDQEILALTETDLETMIKLRMAEEGIKILSEPKEPDYLPIKDKTQKAYMVTGCLYWFLDKEIALKISESLIENKQYYYDDTYKKNWDAKYLEPLKDYKLNDVGNMSCQAFFSKNDAHEISDILETNEKLKKQYEEDLKEYNAIYKEAQTIRDEIYNKFYEIRDKYYEFEKMKIKYKEYLELANNDSQLALTFLKKAYSIDEETENFILK